jgi:hypothetical protein
LKARKESHERENRRENVTRNQKVRQRAARPRIYDAWSSRSTPTIFTVGRSVKRLAV